MKLDWSHQLICNAIPKADTCCCGCMNLRRGGLLIAFTYCLTAGLNFILVTWFILHAMQKRDTLSRVFVIFAYGEDAFDLWLAGLLFFGMRHNSLKAMLIHQWARAVQCGLFFTSLLMGIYVIEPYQLVWGFSYAFRIGISVCFWFQTNSLYREIYDDGRVISYIKPWKPPPLPPP